MLVRSDVCARMCIHICVSSYKCVYLYICVLTCLSVFSYVFVCMLQSFILFLFGNCKRTLCKQYTRVCQSKRSDSISGPKNLCIRHRNLTMKCNLTGFKIRKKLRLPRNRNKCTLF